MWIISASTNEITLIIPMCNAHQNYTIPWDHLQLDFIHACINRLRNWYEDYRWCPVQLWVSACSRHLPRQSSPWEPRATRRLVPTEVQLDKMWLVLIQCIYNSNYRARRASHVLRLELKRPCPLSSRQYTGLLVVTVEFSGRDSVQTCMATCNVISHTLAS